MQGDSNFAGSIPETYDRYLVPLIFEPYARDLCQRLAAGAPRDVLELAAGTGVLTRHMTARLPVQSRITATDLNPAMLDEAARRQPGDHRIAWRTADAQHLPFENGSFDAVACQFGAMFFPDKVGAYREVRRVLRGQGRFLFNVWGDISANDFADVVTSALADVFPGDPPRFMARIPHGYHDTGQIRGELAAAGFGDISLETVEATSRAASPRDAAIAYCQGTPLRNEIEARDSSLLQAATDVVAAALARRFGEGAIEGRIQAHVFTAGC